MDKCLAFCQALVKSDQKFTLNLSIGKDKLFFSNKELASSWKKKKKSPSQLRREENRKINRQNKTTEKVAGDDTNGKTAKETEDNSTVEKAEVPAAIVCDECAYKATTEKGLKQHKRMKHGKPHQSTFSTPEAPRRPSKHGDLDTSPLPQSIREETCHNCDEIFTSTHQCNVAQSQSDIENEEIIEDQDSVAEVVKCNGDGSAPERCVFKDCGMAFTADTRKHAYGIKHTHEEDHIHNAHRFKDPKKYFEKFKLEIATWDCNAEIFMSD